MWGLLRETFKEMLNRPTDIFRCFWPTVVYLIGLQTFSALFLLHYAMANRDPAPRPDRWVVMTYLLALLVLFLVVAPGIIRWHRAVITNQPTKWLPSAPVKIVLSYTLIAALIFFVSVALRGVFSSLYSDLILPIIGYLSHDGSGNSQVPWIFDRDKNPIFRFAEHMKIFLSAVILGRLYMRLPEVSLDMPFKGARSLWAAKERWGFYFALGLLFLFPPLAARAENHLFLMSGWNPDNLPLMPLSSIVALLAWIGSITLMSVAYRRNLHKRKEAAEEFDSANQ